MARGRATQKGGELRRSNQEGEQNTRGVGLKAMDRGVSRSQEESAALGSKQSTPGRHVPAVPLASKMYSPIKNHRRLRI